MALLALTLGACSAPDDAAAKPASPAIAEESLTDPVGDDESTAEPAVATVSASREIEFDGGLLRLDDDDSWFSYGLFSLSETTAVDFQLVDLEGTSATWSPLTARAHTCARRTSTACSLLRGRLPYSR